jgi:hypothetical protein
MLSPGLAHDRQAQVDVAAPAFDRNNLVAFDTPSPKLADETHVV